MVNGVVLEIETQGFEQAMLPLAQGIKSIDAISRTMRKYGNLLQKEAVLNVSGRTVVTQAKGGCVFTIYRQTGKLARSIKVYHEPLAEVVVAEAAYASAVEDGHGPIDLKRYIPRGTIIPIRIKPGDPRPGTPEAILMGALGKSVGPVTQKQKVASTGRPHGSETIAFRRIGTTGWIIPPAKPRPFLEAAALSVAPLLAKELGDVYAAYLQSEKK